MDYKTLLNLSVAIGYQLAISGAETYRVEESIIRLLSAYEVESEVFVIPNCMIVSVRTPDGKSLTRMRRIGNHGNDLDSVELFSGLNRRICTERPEPSVAFSWYEQTKRSKHHYSPFFYYLGNLLGAFGFCIFFGGTLKDAVCAGFCGLIVGFLTDRMEKMEVNPFFRILFASFAMSVPAYILASLHIIDHADTTIIGALMLLVPGLLFTNAMRDIIFGDTNSGTNRVVQVFLIAIAIALGTACAWNLTATLFTPPAAEAGNSYGLLLECLACIIGCTGFAILFNIHGPGIILCALGGMLNWTVYVISVKFGCSDPTACFLAAAAASVYSEIMARIRKFPAISYLVVSIFPLIPGAGVYYTTTYAVQGDMAAFSSRGMQTLSTALAMAVGILLVSTCFRMFIRPFSHKSSKQTP